jgi:hypothetical protein
MKMDQMAVQLRYAVQERERRGTCTIHRIGGADPSDVYKKKRRKERYKLYIPFFFSSLFSSAPFYIFSSSHVCLSVCLLLFLLLLLLPLLLLLLFDSFRQRAGREGKKKSRDMHVFRHLHHSRSSPGVYYLLLFTTRPDPDPAAHTQRTSPTISFFILFFSFFPSCNGREGATTRSSSRNFLPAPQCASPIRPARPPPSAPPFPTLQPKSITRKAEKSKREREMSNGGKTGEKNEKKTI